MWKVSTDSMQVYFLGHTKDDAEEKQSKTK